MEKRISLKDIAQKVGVSTALVSYVLNNQKEGRIGKEVAEKIRATAKKLNYRPNQLAKSLKTNKTFTIGLIVADIANPFFSTLARIIEDEAEKNNYIVIFASSDEKADRSQKLIDVLVDHHVDGIIIAPAENTEAQIKQLKKRNFPFVLLDRNFTDLKVNYVGVNNYDAAYKATCHLIDTGRKRIGMIGFRTTLPNLADRKRGFLKALEDRNVTLPKNALAEVSVDATKEEVDKAIAGMVSVSKPIDALFFASNKLSTFGLKYLNTTSLTVPGDLALCSFDESDATDLFYAPLTHIRQPLREMGEAAVHRLMQVIAGEKKVTQMLLEAELVLGPSTAK